ncbi:hypothetical protein FHS61_002084 [Altererythrobacter atlanticus]|uniref:Uncharacterized protein n=1 Tax=Croceibacterium atlanticum TaxID=1267766 RepID=A0A0F7KR73_9SPHN|nr:hypothetical protein [Croceibacterium atlanticum]AKH41596.1 hypothetical protein WYH_00537 [Croceibacterium atlanticum]MBB5733058.1 hypothetical protein [Croceibacterium atlanticum]
MEFELEDDPIPTEGEENRPGGGDGWLESASDQAMAIPEQEPGRNG